MIQLFARIGAIAALVAAAVQATPVAAQTVNSTGGRLLLTGGVSQIDGAGVGGLTPWALIGGYGSRDQIGANAFYTRVDVDDYALDTYGAMVGFYDRVELSYARQTFDTHDAGAALAFLLGAKPYQLKGVLIFPSRVAIAHFLFSSATMKLLIINNSSISKWLFENCF